MKTRENMAITRHAVGMQEGRCEPTAVEVIHRYRGARAATNLIHGIHPGEVIQHKVRHARADRGRPVALSRGVDLDGRLLGDLMLYPAKVRYKVRGGCDAFRG